MSKCKCFDLFALVFPKNSSSREITQNSNRANNSMHKVIDNVHEGGQFEILIC